MIDMHTNFVAASTYAVASEKLSASEDAARTAMEQRVHRVAGFRGGIVMTDEERTEVVIVTLWDSKESWVRAQWEPTIGDAVAEFVQGARAYDVRTFIPVTVVRPQDAPG